MSDKKNDGSGSKTGGSGKVLSEQKNNQGQRDSASQRPGRTTKTSETTGNTGPREHGSKK